MSGRLGIGSLVSTSTVAEIGALLGDPARVNMMIGLLDGRSWTARELADVAGVSPQTASTHIGKLVAARMVMVERQGRHHYHRLASADVAQLLEQMHVAGESLAAGQAVRRTSGPRDQAMRELRSCYDHLAGRIAVEVSGRLLRRERQPGGAQLSGAGASMLENLGIDLAALERGRRTFCRACIDWSERVPHVAGAVGAALFCRVQDLGWVQSRPTDRTLILTASGERGLFEIFAVSAVRTGA